MGRRGVLVAVVAAALVVVAVAGISVWRLVAGPDELRALPDLCELAETPDVQALVPDADAVFTGSEGEPSPGTASCNVQRTDAATYASLFVFAAQATSGRADEETFERDCAGIGAAPTGDGTRSCVASTFTEGGERVDGFAVRGAYSARVTVVSRDGDGLDDDRVLAVLLDALDRLPPG